MNKWGGAGVVPSGVGGGLALGRINGEEDAFQFVVNTPKRIIPTVFAEVGLPLVNLAS